MKRLFNYPTERSVNLGLLFLRIGIGIMFMIHGAPKMFGGIEKWEKVGSAMASIGLDFAPVFWGFMGAFAEFGGGILLILGLSTRVASVLLTVAMIVAAMKHYDAGDGFKGYAHAAEAAILFFSLIFIGPGKYSIDYRISRKGYLSKY